MSVRVGCRESARPRKVCARGDRTVIAMTDIYEETLNALPRERSPTTARRTDRELVRIRAHERAGDWPLCGFLDAANNWLVLAGDAR